ncbi:TetR/AcrR family transcriptional regulator ['Paenibacillus yunnanensis' Narsing Rao et al. 2020]|uniref:TetR/AcrR family transcriptional regulator n=1 Tax=Paenibacillus tengchongensis TaxID=2608684 RepID=UPI00124D3E42|nr:TetR/AcrR family transcriptional regulator [Paenibacillus tengchongensis]
MINQEPSTKERILAAALDMFSVDGYWTVSIRDIGKAVGIKESSIYYHFKNKEEILHTLLQQAEQVTHQRKQGFSEALSQVTEIKRELFVAAGVAYLEHYLLEERMYKLILMLTLERQRNQEAAAIYHRLLFAAPQEHQVRVFTVMIEQRLIAPADPEVLAAAYQALILYVFHKYFGSGVNGLTEAVRTEARAELSALLNHYYDKMSLQGENGR